MLQLRIRAPFAAFRYFTAGAYRPTAPFMPPSSAYGLLLNFAGVETRLDDGKSNVTLTRDGLPAMELAIGAISFPEVHSVFQQLHNYPVGSSGKERAEDCRGNKYNIQPVRREFLSGFDAYLCCRGDDAIEDRVRTALRGEDLAGAPPRYGIPFLGDNNFILDIAREEVQPAHTARWLRPLSSDEPQEETNRFRLTCSIDRAGTVGTRASLFVWTAFCCPSPPENCWVQALEA